MLTRFEVKGFKSLVDVAIDLGAVNFFIGANGSGKSNLLEAIGFLGAAASGKTDQEALRYRGLRLGSSNSYCHQSSNNLSIIGFDERNCYRAVARPNSLHDWTFVNESITLDGKVIVTGSDNVAEVLRGTTYQKFQAFPEIPSTSISHLVRTYFALMNEHPYTEIDDYDKNGFLANQDFFMTLANYSIFTPSTPQLRGYLDDIRREPLGLGGSNLGHAIKEMIATDSEKLGPFDLDEVLNLIEWADSIGTDALENGSEPGRPIQLRFSDRFMGDGNKTVSAVEASEGALYVLFLLALVGHERSPKMFAVDNFDQALHPRLARELTELICDQVLADGTRQMFATTHNPLVLNGLNLLDDRIRLFTVDRDASGASQIRRVLITKELVAKAEDGFSLAELWTMGRLRGVPQNY